MYYIRFTKNKENLLDSVDFWERKRPSCRATWIDSRVYADELSKVVLVRGTPKGWALGSVNPATRLPLPAGGEFTQPRAHLLADPCTTVVA